MRRRTLPPFTVSAEFTKRQGGEVVAKYKRWMKPDGAWTTQEEGEDTAAKFVLYAATTPMERIRIDGLCARWAGESVGKPSEGEQVWAEMVGGVIFLTRKAQAELIAHLWPDERPKPGNAGEEAAQQALVEREWASFDHPAKEALLAMQQRVELLRFLARWETCMVQVPPGWETLGDGDMFDDDVIMAVWNAFSEQVHKANEGNA